MAKHLSIDNSPAPVRDFFKQLGEQAGECVLEIEGQPVVGIVPAWQVEKFSQDNAEILSLLRQSWDRNRDVPHFQDGAVAKGGRCQGAALSVWLGCVFFSHIPARKNNDSRMTL